jgi:1,4-dihydroxy-2-naphthoyl-CoA synthase
MRVDVLYIEGCPNRDPAIAAVHGACLGAGMDLITACDIRIASACATASWAADRTPCPTTRCWS